ncbi:hypothetical protein PFISCL1PPCAC_18581, partial [Pristionchus fissidentatus]
RDAGVERIAGAEEDTDGRVRVGEHRAVRVHHYISALVDGRTLRDGNGRQVGVASALLKRTSRVRQNVERRLYLGVRLRRDRIRLLGRLQTLRGAASQGGGLRARDA